MILAGDIGGTKTRLATFSWKGSSLVKERVERFSSGAFPSLEEIIVNFLGSGSERVTAACFGVPGPVRDGEVRTTNLPWGVIRESELSTRLSIPKVRLVNDLVSTTAAIPLFTDENIEVIHPGPRRTGDCVCAVLAPGTGTGQAAIVGVDGRHHVLASEGGHVDFSPVDDLQIELLRWLRTKYGRVSLERVLCGPGLYNIYQFLRDTGRGTESPELKEMLLKEDPAAVVSRTGLSGEEAISSAALDIFCSILGAQAGNIMLTYMASGGVYLGGGIPPKIIERIKAGRVVESYLNKGRLSGMVKQAPLFAIKDDQASVLGAAYLASLL